MTTTAAPGPIEAPSRTSAPPPASAIPEEEGARPQRRRTKLFVVVGIVVAAILAGALAWWLFTRGKETTDDAQVQADVVALAPRVGGAVKRVLVQENQAVKAGDTLLELDDADYVVKVKQGEAEVQVATAALVRAKPEEHLNA